MCLCFIIATEICQLIRWSSSCCKPYLCYFYVKILFYFNFNAAAWKIPVRLLTHRLKNRHNRRNIWSSQTLFSYWTKNGSRYWSPDLYKKISALDKFTITCDESTHTLIAGNIHNLDQQYVHLKITNGLDDFTNFRDGLFDIYFHGNRHSFQMQHTALEWVKEHKLFDVLINNQLYNEAEFGSFLENNEPCRELPEISNDL